MWLLCLVTALQIGVGGWLLYRHFKVRLSASRVRGTTLEPRVVGETSDSGESYATRFEYHVDGTRYVGEAKAISNCRRCHRKGRRVWVYYEQLPQNGRLLYWWEPAVYALLVAVGVSVSLALLLQHRVGRAKAPNPSIEGTSSTKLRLLPAVPHIKH